jgi:nitrite reductase/ring-hydroxylating ferredoxin subunit
VTHGRDGGAGTPLASLDTEGGREGATPSELAFQELAADVDRAIADADRLEEPRAREAAAALRAALERFHKVGLTTIVSRLKADPHGKALLFDLLDAPEVRALLSLHGLIRPPAGAEGAPAAPLAPAPPPPRPVPISAVIPVSALKVKPAAGAPRVERGWLPGPALSDISESRPYRLDLRDTSLVLIRRGDQVHAYRNECAHQGLPIDGGLIDRESGTITCPWHGFRFDCATGECLTAPHVQLEVVRSRLDAGVVHVQLD